MTSSDPVLEALTAIARDVFPAVYTVEVSHGGPIPGGSVSVLHTNPQVLADHPGLLALTEALSSDSDLRHLAPTGSEPGYVKLSTGTGYHLRPSSLAVGLIGTAAEQVLLKGRSIEELDVLVGEVADALARLRRLSAGEEADLLVVTAFDGISLPADAQVETPWGSLGPASEAARHLRPVGIGEASVVLLSEVPLRMRIYESSGQFDEEPYSDHDLAEHLSALPLRVALAVLLGVERDDPLAPGYLWQTAVGPLGQARGVSLGRLAGVRIWAPGGGEPLDHKERDHVSDAAKLVDAHLHPSMTLAVSRTLSAIRERSYEEDALVDAVIAWEGLFGHGGTSEVTFRVTTALALLLEPEPTARGTFRRELSKIYTLRSKVVHGEALKPRDRPRAAAAIEIGVWALRTLFRERPDLLPDRERGFHLILEPEQAPAVTARSEDA